MNSMLLDQEAAALWCAVARSVWVWETNGAQKNKNRNVVSFDVCVQRWRASKLPSVTSVRVGHPCLSFTEEEIERPWNCPRRRGV